MNRAKLNARLAELNVAREGQQDRLAKARQEEREAIISLERVEGATQDCKYWLLQLDQAEAAAKHAEQAETNRLAETFKAGIEDGNCATNH